MKVKAYDLIMCGYFVDTLDLLTSCSKVKSSDSTNLFLQLNFEKNGVLILNYFLK